MSNFFEGMLYGLLFILAFGPAFFGMMQTTLHRNWRFGLAFASAIWLTDSVFITLILFGLSSFVSDPGFRFWLGLFGALVLLIYGTVSLIHRNPKRPPVVVGTSPVSSFLRGVLMNGLNPLIIVFWVGLIGAISTNRTFSQWEYLQFFGGLLTTIICLDLLKIALIHKLSQMLHARWFGYMSRVIGVIFIGFGLRILVYLIWGI